MTQRIGTEELSAARADLRLRRDALADFTALHRRMGEALLSWVERNFAAEGALLDEFPSGWPRLAPSTIARRMRRGRGTRVLYDTGRLAGAFQVLPGAEQAVVDNPVPYAAAHQEGLGVPRRPIFPERAQALAVVSPAAELHVQEALS
jgi:phage gpG-like protein